MKRGCSTSQCLPIAQFLSRKFICSPPTRSIDIRHLVCVKINWSARAGKCEFTGVGVQGNQKASYIFCNNHCHNVIIYIINYVIFVKGIISFSLTKYSFSLITFFSNSCSGPISTSSSVSPHTSPYSGISKYSSEIHCTPNYVILRSHTQAYIFM